MLLYKYQKAKWGIAILRELRLKVTPPNEFNDPFEFTPVTTNPIENLRPDKLALLREYLRKQGLDAPVEDLKVVLPELIRVHPFVRDFAKGLITADNASRDESSKHFGVLCLSEPSADIRMWSHYGNNHRGVAIGLAFDKEVSGIDGVISFKKVRYSKRRQQLNPMASTGKDFHSQVEKTAVTKSADWADEREHRMIFRLESLQKEPREQCGSPVFDYFLHIGPETIREVVMGCFISDRDEARIRSLLAAKLPSVKLIKLRRHHSEFRLVSNSVTVARDLPEN